jgi:hypothetical protein
MSPRYFHSLEDIVSAVAISPARCTLSVHAGVGISIPSTCQGNGVLYSEPLHLLKDMEMESEQ